MSAGEILPVSIIILKHSPYPIFSVRIFTIYPRNYSLLALYSITLWGLIIPFALLGPSKLRNMAGLCMIIFQVVLIVSGNLSFLNWLTILPCILCVDDPFGNTELQRLGNHSFIPVFHTTSEAIFMPFLCVSSVSP